MLYSFAEGFTVPLLVRYRFSHSCGSACRLIIIAALRAGECSPHFVEGSSLHPFAHHAPLEATPQTPLPSRRSWRGYMPNG